MAHDGPSGNDAMLSEGRRSFRRLIIIQRKQWQDVDHFSILPTFRKTYRQPIRHGAARGEPLASVWAPL